MSIGVWRLRWVHAALLLSSSCQSSGPKEKTPAPAPTSSAGAAGTESMNTSAGAAPGNGNSAGAGADSSAGAGSNAADLWAACDHVEVSADCEAGWCAIPAGCFVMGAPATEFGYSATEELQTLVKLTRSFVIQRTEVTQGEWIATGLSNPSGVQPNGQGDCTDDPECPVGRVTWFEALAYANLLSEQQGLGACYVLHGCEGEIGKDFSCTAAEATKPTIYECAGYRLPTDAEWEYAARAGTRTAFYSGDIATSPEQEADPTACLRDEHLLEIAWYCNNSEGKSHPVAQRTANAWGLFDMAGNAEEWVTDRSDGRPAIAAVDPDGTVGLHSSRNTRGGSFVSWPPICRSAKQLGAGWNDRRVGLGFRLARTGTLNDR
jgi:formylglycine-generating enzyme